MLTPDDGSRDGGFRSYLQDPDTWMRYDPTAAISILPLANDSGMCYHIVHEQTPSGNPGHDLPGACAHLVGMARD